MPKPTINWDFQGNRDWLIRLWREGKHRDEIAKAMGISKNAVVGAAYRFGLTRDRTISEAVRLANARRRREEQNQRDLKRIRTPSISRGPKYKRGDNRFIETWEERKARLARERSDTSQDRNSDK